MKATLEREVKLRPGPRFERVALSGREIDERTLTSTYYDTEDLRLAAGSVTLRRRQTDDGPAAWQLKLQRAGDRLELEWEAPDERVPDELSRLVTAHTRGRPLSAVATLRTRRSGVVVQQDGTDVAEVVHDAVEVLEDGVTRRGFEEIEVELVDGDVRALRAIEDTLRRAGAEDPDGRPKLFQALDLRPPAAPAAPDDPAAALQATLRAQYREILAHDPGSRLGDDPEELHDHRVAVRRLRAMLRAGRPLLDRVWADDLRGALRQAGRALADVRDLDVLTADLERLAGGLEEPERAGATDVLERFRERRDAAHARLNDELCEAWYVSLLNRLEAGVDAPRFAGHGSLTKAAAKEHRRARRLVRTLPKRPADADLHELRKAVKRARYAAELASAAGASGLGKYVKRAKTLQDVLGDHQDAAVASAELAAVDPELGRPAAHLAVRALQQAQEQRRTAARSAFPKAWRRLDKRARAVF
jgi:CHAD domain-containing protein